MRRIRSTVVVVSVVLLVGGFRLLFPERPLHYTGVRALLDAGFALGLLGLVLLLAGGLGRKVLRWLRLEELSDLERVVFGLPLGLGILAYVVLALGLAGLLRTWAILLWLVVAGAWAWRDWAEIAGRVPGWLAQQPGAFKALGLGGKALLILGALILALATLQALTPPWGYDGLMYHLQGPRLFLQAGRISLLPDVWQANGPLTVEMVFGLGLSLGSDTFARLLHLTYAVCLVLGTFSFGRRFLGGVGGWVATAVLLGIPILPLWAGLAYVDVAWALYEFLGLYGLILWMRTQQTRLLMLGGLMTGWAVGSKYLGLGQLGILGFWTLWQGRNEGWKRCLADSALFAFPAILVGSPWYVKNWLWSGNPVYPFFFGGFEWDTERLGLVMRYLRSFGVGRSLLDCALLPWNLYAHHGRFTSFRGSIEIPGLLFPLVLLYPWVQRRRSMNSVAAITLLRFVLWALDSQQVRFLLPLFPALSLLASSVLVDLARRIKARRWRRTALGGLLGGVVAATVVYQALLFGMVSPVGVILGTASKDDFLRRAVADYPALQFIERHLSPEARVMMMWDGQGYYCDERCLPDTEQSQWTRLTLSAPSVSSVAASLKALGVTHLLFSVEDAGFFLGHDPAGEHRRALRFFLDEFRGACAEEIYQDQAALLFEVSCP